MTGGPAVIEVADVFRRFADGQPPRSCLVMSLVTDSCTAEVIKRQRCALRSPGQVATAPRTLPKPNLFLSAFRFEDITYGAAGNSFAFHGIAPEDDFGV